MNISLFGSILYFFSNGMFLGPVANLLEQSLIKWGKIDNWQSYPFSFIGAKVAAQRPLNSKSIWNKNVFKSLIRKADGQKFVILTIFYVIYLYNLPKSNERVKEI